MGLYGCHRHAGGCCNLCQVHLVEEAHDEDRTLAWGEIFDCVLNASDLLAGEHAAFGGGLPGVEVLAQLCDIGGGVAEVAPEFELLCTCVVAHEVGSDAHEPCRDGAITTEGSTTVVRLEEAVLGDGLRCIHV